MLIILWFQREEAFGLFISSSAQFNLNNSLGLGIFGILTNKSATKIRVKI